MTLLVLCAQCENRSQARPVVFQLNSEILKWGPFGRRQRLNTGVQFYKVGARAIKEYKPLANTRLDEITSETAAEFAAYRQFQGRKVSTVNSSLRVLRRVLGLAVEWGVLQSAPKIKKLPGERHREHLVSFEEEAKYLTVASEPLGSVAAILVDTGMRPEECFRLRWESIAWVNGRHGTLLVTHGKTAAARRVLPMTPRVRNILEARWESAGKPVEGWIWPAHPVARFRAVFGGYCSQIVPKF